MCANAQPQSASGMAPCPAKSRGIPAALAVGPDAAYFPGKSAPPLSFRGVMPARPPPRRKTARGKLVGVAVFCAAWVGAGHGLHGAVIETSVIPDLAVMAAGPDASATVRARAGGPLIAQVLEIARPCSAAGEFGPRPVSCQKRAEPADTAALPSPDLLFDPAPGTLVAPSEISVAASDFEIMATRPSFDSLQPLSSGTTPELLDELIARPDEADDAGPLWSGNVDILRDYMVPALAIPALVVGALLLREVVRRRRRAISARRIRHSFGRSARRRLHASSPSPD